MLLNSSTLSLTVAMEPRIVSEKLTTLRCVFKGRKWDNVAKVNSPAEFWVTVKCFGGLNTLANKYVTKGSLVTVTGGLEVSEYEGKTNLEIVCNGLAWDWSKAKDADTPSDPDNGGFTADTIPF